MSKVYDNIRKVCDYIGAIVLPNGMIALPNGSLVLQNGVIILPTKIKTFNFYTDTYADTEDKVFLYSGSEMCDRPEKEGYGYVYATDYAVMCGAGTHDYDGDGYKDKPKRWKKCRSCNGTEKKNVEYFDSSRYPRSAPWNTCFVSYPVLHLDLESFISAHAQSAVRIGSKHLGSKHYLGDICFHTATIGLEFPKTYVGEILDKKLTSLKNNGQLRKTGAKYTGFMRDDRSFVQNEEYEYNGERYVLIEVKKDECNKYNRLENHKICPETGEYAWAKVEPILFQIQNWDDLPRSINPEGNGSAKFVEMETEEGIISGLPFYPKSGKSEFAMWQNSLDRAYLNGYNLHKEIDKGNGNKKYKALENFDFEGKGFLFEASQGLGLHMEAKHDPLEPEKETKPNTSKSTSREK